MELNATTLIIIPLAILLVLSGASVCGLGTEDLSTEFIMYQAATNSGVDSLGNAIPLNDRYGNPICYYNQTSIYGEAGQVIWIEANTYPPQEAAWRNATNYYQLFYDSEGADPVFYADLQNGVISRPQGRIGPQWQGLQTFSITDSWGWLALIGVVVTVVSIVGFKIAASGESETSIHLILKATFFVTMWVTLSVVTYPLILVGGFLVFIIYSALTLIYSVGVIMSVGNN